MPVLVKSEGDSPATTKDDNDKEGDAEEPRAAGLAVADLLTAPSRESPDGDHKATLCPKESSKSPIPEAQATSSLQTAISAKEQKSASASNVNEGVTAYQYTAMQQVVEDRDNVEYKLTIREQPKHSRMCGVGEKADRRPIDPAPIVQLRVIVHDRGPPSEEAQDQESDEILPLSKDQQQQLLKSPTTASSKSKTGRRGTLVRTNWGAGWEDKTWYLENPYYFMYAMLAEADTDEELHLLQDGKTRYTTGSCVSCLYHLKDIDGTEQGFFVFPDLSIRVEGRYRLKLCLFETIGHEVYHCKSVYSTPFNVYTAKRFPGMEESTVLSRSFADQGLKVRVRRNPRLRRGRISGKRKDMLESDDESVDERRAEDTPQVNPQRPMMVKRFRSNDGQQEYGSHEQQQQQQQQQQHQRYQPRPPYSYNRPSEHPSHQGHLHYRHSNPSQSGRRYTDSAAGPPQMFVSDGRPSYMPSDHARHMDLATHHHHQQQHQSHMQHHMDTSRSDSQRYSHGSTPGERDTDRRDTMMRHGEQQPSLQYDYKSFAMDSRNHPLRPLPSGLPGLRMDDYKDRQDNTRNVLPPLHQALSSYQQQSDQQSLYRDVRPSSSGTSPRSIPAAALRKMPPDVITQPSERREDDRR